MKINVLSSIEEAWAGGVPDGKGRDENVRTYFGITRVAGNGNGRVMKARRMHEQGLAEMALKAGDYERAGQLFETVVFRPSRKIIAPGSDWSEIAADVGDAESAHAFYGHAVGLSPDTASYRQRLGEWCCRLGSVAEGVAQQAGGRAGAGIAPSPRLERRLRG